jgi:formylmethanofuran dehydrogenase subunit D
MKEYVELGHMQLVAEVNGDDGKETVYLPHHIYSNMIAEQPNSG